MMPELHLQGILTVLPIVNVVLLARDLFDRSRESSIDPITATIVIVPTLMYALAALSLGARVFGAEITTVGRFVEGEPSVRLREASGEERPLVPAGHDHFRALASS